jgi:hypothetical protein
VALFLEGSKKAISLIKRVISLVSKLLLQKIEKVTNFLYFYYFFDIIILKFLWHDILLLIF